MYMFTSTQTDRHTCIVLSGASWLHDGKKRTLQLSDTIYRYDALSKKIVFWNTHSGSTVVIRGKIMTIKAVHAMRRNSCG